MKYGILAAGEGSRLAEEGVPLPKPLVRLCGEAMIDRLIRVFSQCGASEIDIIVNDLHASTLEHLCEVCKTNPLVRYKVKSTPSSMHSFYELMPMLGEGKFCLTTVDTIFREQEFQEFISRFQQCEEDGMMAVTDFVDDEKPLYISTDAGFRITGFHDNKDALVAPQITPKGLHTHSRGASEATPPDSDVSPICAEGTTHIRHEQWTRQICAVPSALTNAGALTGGVACGSTPGYACYAPSGLPCTFISGGIYCLSEKAFPTLIRCIEAGKARMRNFQRQLIEDGLRLVAYPFSKILDVDHASDIPKAEAFLRGL